MRYEWAVGETGYQSRISHPSAPRRSSPPITNHYSPITAFHSLITAFLIDTPAIRNTSNSFAMNASSLSNRHSSGPWLSSNLASRNWPSIPLQAAHGPELPRKRSTEERNLISSISSSSSTSSTSRLHFASKATLREVPSLHSNLLCYSPPVTRVPPSGPRESAPARSHGYGVDVSSPRNASFTGAFPHKFNRSTGLIGSASLALRASHHHGRNTGLVERFMPDGFRSPESPVDNRKEDVAKEITCAS